MKRIAVVDTTFARVDMGSVVEEELSRLGTGFQVQRTTVPGIKDLAVACKRLLEDGCDLALALGMPGPDPLDRQSALTADWGLQQAQLLTNKHILGVFVYEEEGQDFRNLKWLAEQRAREHARNAFQILFQPEKLRRRAGTGQREGFEDVGPLVAD